MKRLSLLLLAPFAGLTLAGCGASSTQTTANPARGIAASFVAGRAFDRSQSALKSGNEAALQAAGRRFASAAQDIDDRGILLAGVKPISQAGTILELRAKYSPLAQREVLLKQALAKYRAASAFLPADPKLGSVDADTLNQVGYPLADRGTTRADWERGAQLTRLSLAQWDKQINALSPDDPQRQRLQAARTVGALDSYAWSLFRLGRVGEALQKQEKVMAFVRENPNSMSAEVSYHMAEIYRAAGREDEAEEQYRAALGLSPDPELAANIEVALTAARV